jgi:hypothetical protein
MKYSVWLFTRPLSYSAIFPPLAKTSDGKEYFRHWAILVSEMTLIDAQVILERTTQYGGDEDTNIGTMYELFRDERDRNNVNVTRPFKTSTLRRRWQTFSVQYVGETEMNHKMIEREGIRII